MTHAEWKLVEGPLRSLDVAHRLVARWSEMLPLNHVLSMALKPFESLEIPDAIEAWEAFGRDGHLVAATSAYVQAVRPTRVNGTQHPLFLDEHGVPITEASHALAMRTAWENRDAWREVGGVRALGMPAQLVANILERLDPSARILISWTAHATFERISCVSLLTTALPVVEGRWEHYVRAPEFRMSLPDSVVLLSRPDWRKRSAALIKDGEFVCEALPMFWFDDDGLPLSADYLFETCLEALRAELPPSKPSP